MDAVYTVAAARQRDPHLMTHPDGEHPERSGGEWGVIVAHCLRSWLAAEASVRAFLDAWSPRLPVPSSEPAPPTPRTRRRPARRRALAARRPARRPSERQAAAPGNAIFDAIEPALLRRRFPYVAELLVELGSSPPAPHRSARRR
jgi:hypothetical protein